MRITTKEHSAWARVTSGPNGSMITRLSVRSNGTVLRSQEWIGFTPEDPSRPASKYVPWLRYNKRRSMAARLCPHSDEAAYLKAEQEFYDRICADLRKAGYIPMYKVVVEVKVVEPMV